MLYMQSFSQYQIEVFKMFEDFRPKYQGVSYPPYHNGVYLEESFYHNFISKGGITDKIYIPVFWTNCYLNEQTDGLQAALDKLDPDKEYFTVSQHDDAVKEVLPKKTMHFNAGGNKDGIPIPLVCSPIPRYKAQKKTFCSFVGSTTHPIRNKMYKALNGQAGFEIYGKEWSGDVAKEHQDFFIKKTAESIFSLCPRGYGASSFRLYEAMQLGAVPVVIYDKPWFPFMTEVDWTEFAVLIPEEYIGDIKDILLEKAPFADIMSKKAQENYFKYFSMGAFPNQIYKYLNAQ
ncbi:glycosyltransferase family 47 protein [bacterium]|nr:glycosyltransferase family 47 protein [bacterium]